MFDQERAKPIDLVGNTVAAQGPPIGRGVDRQHWLVEPEIGDGGEPCHGEIGADLDHGFDIGAVDLQDRVA
jgi:hypothetical protein